MAYEEGSYEVMRGYVAPGEVVLMPCGRRVQPARDDGDHVADKVEELLVALHGEGGSPGRAVHRS